MREKVRDRGRLEHILEAIESIEEFHAQYTFEDIKKNKLIFYGFTKLVARLSICFQQNFVILILM